jgi:serine/threonine protein kinase
MPFLESREATLADLEVDHVTDAVTMPVFFLSQQGLIYVDIRAPNVLLTHDGQVRLIDYDDCAIVTVMPTTYVQFKQCVADGREAVTTLSQGGIALRTAMDVTYLDYLPKLAQRLQAMFDQKVLSL